MTLDNFPGFKWTMKVVETGVEGNGQGSIRVQTLVESEDSKLKKGAYASYDVFDGKENPERFMIVEEDWFTANEKRKIKLIEE